MTKWCKVYTKADSWFQKSHEEFGQLQGKKWKVQQVEIQWATFVKKIHSSVKILYTEDFFNITFNYLCENSPNSSRHF